MYLLDTNIISELRRAKPHGAVVAWLGTVADEHLYVSAVTLGELQAGIELVREQDAEKAASIEVWVDSVAQTRNILPMDAQTFRVWARLMHHRSSDLMEDAMVAATARVHDLTVVTRNTKDFAPLGVRTLNPFVTKRRPS
jgi:predicted nucleic acid-binding protein